MWHSCRHQLTQASRKHSETTDAPLRFFLGPVAVGRAFADYLTATELNSHRSQILDVTFFCYI